MTIKASPRNLVAVLSILLMIGLVAAYGQVASAFDVAGLQRVWLSLGMGIGMFLLMLSWPTLHSKVEAPLILGATILLRLLILPAAPSDDIHRYLWEGKLVALGVSPYAAPASDARYAEYYDTQWAQMNHRDALTAYPPGAELIFALLTDVAYTPWCFKACFALMDFGVVALLLALLRRRALPLRWAGWYAFNPVVLIAFAAEGHFDVLMVLALVAAIYAVERRWMHQAAFLIGVAVMMKFIAVLALPFLLRRIGWRYGASFIATILLIGLPFYADWPNLLRGLFEFGSATNFNGLPYLLLLDSLGSRTAVNMAVMAVFVGLLAWRFFRRRCGAWELDWLFAVGALLVLSPTVHFWYLTWLLPIIALRPSLSWLAFSISMAGYYCVWWNVETGSEWALTLPQQWLIWAPFLSVGLWEICAFRRQSGQGNTVTMADGLSVIIPVLNAEALLPACVASLKDSSLPPDEILVVDGGSEDNTWQVGEALQCKVIKSDKGRGQQIAAGLCAAKYRYALILHADCQVAQYSLANLRQAVIANPDVVGGALGQRFSERSWMLLLIEALNEVRATMGGVAFGDQAQFFDRQALADDEFPAQPLMEDVELSWRLRSKGRLLYLGQEVTSASAKWQKVGSWRRIVLVFRFVVAYRWARWRGRDKAADLSQRLYEEYYSK